LRKGLGILKVVSICDVGTGTVLKEEMSGPFDASGASEDMQPTI
jgi:hypothetical protein